jgi:hypothetical protein
MPFSPISLETLSHQTAGCGSRQFGASLTCAFSLLLLSSLHTASGDIPNQSYPEDEKHTIISPQLSTRHMNQPSVFNGYAVFAGNAKHEVWDISDPYQPTFQAEMISNHADGEAESHQVTYGRDAGGTYYMATISGCGIDLWDMSDTTSPQAVSEIILPGINHGDVAGAIWGVSWQGDYVYCGATTNGLYVVDVSDPANPEHVATLSRSALGGIVAVRDTPSPTSPDPRSDSHSPPMGPPKPLSPGKSASPFPSGRNSHPSVPKPSFSAGPTAASPSRAHGAAPTPP